MTLVLKLPGLRMTERPSPNFNDRKGGAKPSFIILHYTGMKTAEEALDRLCDPGVEVSAHYLVHEDGAVVRMVDEDKRAWHAGKSRWGDETDLNSLSVGIEIVNPGHEHGYRPFPQAQMQAVAALCRAVMDRHGIAPFNILAHSDIAPARKEDPGELFDWRGLAARGIGVWPEPSPEDYKAMDEAALREALTACGYDPEAPLPDIVRAFQRHFYPEVFAAGPPGEDIPPETAARLNCLIRMKKSAQ